MKKKLTSSLLALSLAFNTAPVLTNQVFAQDDLTDEVIEIEEVIENNEENDIIDEVEEVEENDVIDEVEENDVIDEVEENVTEPLFDEELDALIQAENEAIENDGVSTYDTYGETGTTENGLGYYTLNNEVYISKYTGTGGNITIPGSIGNLPVVHINDSVFKDNTTLTSVVMSTGLKTIGTSAFDGCTNLKSVTIPNTVTTIKLWAFQKCTSLESITIPDSVTELRKTVFWGCTSLESVTLSKNITEIPDHTFTGCDSLTSIEIPNGVTSIGGSAFNSCDSLESIVIPEGVTIIKSSAFSGCISLTNAVLPDSLDVIEWGIFTNCSNLENVTMPKSATSMGNSIFYNCLNLKSIVIPEGITTIERATFVACRSLESVVIPDSVTSIEDMAFYGCSSLTNVIIPDDVTYLGEQAFSGCSLTSIQLPAGITTIEYGTFIGCDFTSVVIPDGVTSIGRSAFSSCRELESVDIPDSVTFIDDYAFNYCESLTKIDIPDGVTSIGDYTFYRCSSMTKIYIPDTVTSIGDRAFGSCKNLSNVYYGGSESQWGAIDIGTYNEYLTGATIHYNSTMPADPTYKITVPTGVTTGTVTGNDDVASGFKLTSYSYATTLDSFTLLGDATTAKTEGIKVTVDGDPDYTTYSIVHFPSDGSAAITYGPFTLDSNNSFTFYPEKFSNFYVVGITSNDLGNDEEEDLVLKPSIQVDLVVTEYSGTLSTENIDNSSSGDFLVEIDDLKAALTGVTVTNTQDYEALNKASSISVEVEPFAKNDDGYADVSSKITGLSTVSTIATAFDLNLLVKDSSSNDLKLSGNTITFGTDLPITINLGVDYNSSNHALYLVTSKNNVLSHQKLNPKTTSNSKVVTVSVPSFSYLVLANIDKSSDKTVVTSPTTSTPSTNYNTYNSGSGSFYTFSGSVAVNGTVITEFRNILSGEMVNLNRITTVNGEEVIGWYYDAAFTQPIENTSTFVFTESIINNGLYAKTTGTVNSTLSDGSYNAGAGGVISGSTTDTNYVPTAVPSTIAKLLGKLF